MVLMNYFSNCKWRFDKKNIKNYYLYYSINDGLYTIMLLYVDDLIIMGDNIKKKYNS